MDRGRSACMPAHKTHRTYKTCFACNYDKRRCVVAFARVILVKTMKLPVRREIDTVGARLEIAP